jgi:hypothetical protein
MLAYNALKECFFLKNTQYLDTLSCTPPSALLILLIFVRAYKEGEMVILSLMPQPAWIVDFSIESITMLIIR